jgi:hypothetical protein
MSEDGYPIITLPPQSVPPLGIWNMKVTAESRSQKATRD